MISCIGTVLWVVVRTGLLGGALFIMLTLYGVALPYGSCAVMGFLIAWLGAILTLHPDHKPSRHRQWGTNL